MEFEEDPGHGQIRQTVQRMMRDFPDEYWMDCDQDSRFPWDFYNAFAAAGLLGIMMPEEYGGAGLGLAEASLVLEEVAASGAAMAGASAVHLTMFGLNPVVKHGSEAMKRAYLPPAIKGELHVCFGVTEPNAGTDTARITTRAVRDGAHYVIDGQKVWTTKAQDCQKVLLLTRTTPLEECRKRTDGMTLFLADLDPAHVTIRPIRKMGRHAVGSNEVFITGLRVAVEDRVGEEGKGFSYLLDGLNPERILCASEALGMGRAALRHATAYAKDRVVFNRPIGQNQGIQFPLADSLTKLDAATLVRDKAAWLYDQGRACGREANTAKYLASESGFEACDRAVQTLGGFGYAAEFHVERYFRECRILRLAPISQNLVLSYLAEHVMGLPRSF